MKFSILTLLAATGYSAIVFAALAQPDSWWRHVFTVAWFFAIVYALALATDSANRRKSMFGRVVLGGTVAYLLLIAVARSMPLSSQGTDLWPHQWLVNWLSDDALGQLRQVRIPAPPRIGRTSPGIPIGTSGWDPADLIQRLARLETVSAMITALAIGLLGGCLALWRYRVLERREKKEQSGE